jgi:hypothetical protein
MSLEQEVREYFAAWNARDAERLQSRFMANGKYEDPTRSGPAEAPLFRRILEEWLGFLPDFHFEIKGVQEAGGAACAEWVLHATHAGPYRPGFEPTGRRIELPGCDIFEGAAGFRSARRYFDQRALTELLGLQTIVEPYAQGPATYGYSKRVTSGNPAPPAVLGLTWIEFRGAEELDRIRVHSSGIIQDFLEEPGFLSIVTGAAGNRAFTVTAWESEEAMQRALAKTHSRAKHDFQTTEIATGVWTSVWHPVRVNRLWSRCAQCSAANDRSSGRRQCGRCGAELETAPLYW